MKNSLLTPILVGLLLLCTPTAAQAQPTCTVTGTAVDSASRKPIPFVTAAVSTDGKEPIKAAAADASGRFRIPLKQLGDFVLTLTYVGYGSANVKFNADSTQKSIDLGTISMQAGVQVEGVTVTVQKPLIKTDADKMTYSVEADPDAQTSTLLEILRKVPQLSVDAEGNVKLNGNSNYKVLVNGKSSGMLSKNFKDVIKSLPANTIRDIEVITNPSMKYEAEGAGGIINIVTTHGRIGGYNIAVQVGAETEGNLYGGAYAMVQAGKFGIGARYFEYYFDNPSSYTKGASVNYLSEDSRYNRFDYSNKGHGNNRQFGLELSYEIDSLNLLSTYVYGIINPRTYVSYQVDSTWNELETPTRIYNQLTSNHSRYECICGSLDYQRSFRKKDELLTFSYQFDLSRDNGYMDYIVDGTLNYNPYTEHATDYSPTDSHTIQIDYFNPIGKHQIEGGVKYRYVNNESNSDISRLENEIWVPVTERTNDMDYIQHVLGLYGGYAYKTEKFSVKGGFRMEGTWNDGTSKMPDGHYRFHNKMINFIPYVNFFVTPKPSHNLQLSYTQRLRRPSIWSLNPYVDRSEPMSIYYGNPDLEAVVNHSFSLNYSKFSSSWNLFAGLYASFATNDINQVTRFTSQGVSETTYINVGKNQNYGVNLSGSYRLRSILNVNASASANYTVLDAPTRDLHNEGFNISCNLGISVVPWKGGRINLNGGYSTSSVNLQGKSSSYSYSSLSLAQKFFKERFEVSARVSQPFRKYRTTTSTKSDETFRRRTEWQYRSRNIAFSMTFMFGKAEVRVKKAQRTISNDDSSGGKGR